MNEFHDNLWAPWRMEYIHSLSDEGTATGCFLCDYRDAPDRDPDHHVVWRTERSFVLMNRFPYTNGHLLIAPLAHKDDLDHLADEELIDMCQQSRLAKQVLQQAVGAHGFNIGINLGRCAGAGLPGHIHAHIVPRWNGDTNFMAVLGDVRVIPQALDRLYVQLCEVARSLGLPGGGS